MCLWWEKETGLGSVFPPGVSVHVNENDLALLMSATSNTRAICGKTRMNIFRHSGGCIALNTHIYSMLQLTQTHTHTYSKAEADGKELEETGGQSEKGTEG